MQHAEYEVDLDATEATLNVIEEQLESDSPIMQAEGALKVSAGRLFTTHSTPELSLQSVPNVAVSTSVKKSVHIRVNGGVSTSANCGGTAGSSLKVCHKSCSVEAVSGWYASIK